MAEHQNHRARRLRLEEQARRRGLSEKAVQQRVQQYEARWTSWAERQLRAALSGLIISNGQIMSKYIYALLALVTPMVEGSGGNMVEWIIDRGEASLELQLPLAEGNKVIRLKSGESETLAGRFRIISTSKPELTIDGVPKIPDQSIGSPAFFDHITTPSGDTIAGSCGISSSLNWNRCYYPQTPNDQTVNQHVLSFNNQLLLMGRSYDTMDWTGRTASLSGMTEIKTGAGWVYGTYKVYGVLKRWGNQTVALNINPSTLNLKCGPAAECAGVVQLAGYGFWGSADLRLNLSPNVEVYTDGIWRSGTVYTALTPVRRNVKFRVLNPPVGSSTYSVPMTLSLP